MKSQRNSPSKDHLPRIQGFLRSWIRQIESHATLVLAICLAVTAASLWNLLGNLKIDTSTADMLSEDVLFRRNDAAMERAFPQLDDTIVLVIDGTTPEQADEAAERLVLWLQTNGTQFRSIYAPEVQPFFRRNGLLYASVEELSDLSDRLAAAQPLLGTLAQDRTLRGLADVMAQAAEHTTQEESTSLAIFLNQMQEVVEAMRGGSPRALSWQSLLSGEDTDPLTRRRFVVVQPRLEPGALQPAAAAISFLRTGVQELGLVPANGVTVRLTGSVALEHEELESVQAGGLVSSTLSLALVTLLLIVGLLSWRLVLATVVTLLVGLVWTAAFATAVVGRFNLMSVAFAALFIGLAVDFSIHLCLRYREEVKDGRNASTALMIAGGAVGGAIILAAIAAAAGFLSFVPTDYKGLAELGLISAAGMILAVVTNLTLLPALLALLPIRRIAYGEISETRSVEAFARRHAPGVILSSLVLGLAGIASIPFVRFDFDPIHLQDPRMESVATFLDLARDPRTAPYTIQVLARDIDQAIDLAHRLQALPDVKDALTLQSFIPEDQDTKLRIIEDVAYFIGPLLQPPPAPTSLTPEERRNAFSDLDQALLMLSAGTGPAAEAATGLRTALHRLSNDRTISERVLLDVEQRLMLHFPVALDRLATALEARPVGLDDLPADLRERWVNADGQARIELRPAQVVLNNQELRRFADAVQKVAPNAVGTPVIVTQATNVVLAAFVEASILAAALVTLILLVVLHSAFHIMLVLLPLALAAALTCLTVVALDLPFNFANIIALPLLFGLGVSSAIHVVLRWREESRGYDLIPTSTSRGVLYSALTTIASLGSLATSGHRGMASMGYLLTIAIGYTLVTTLFVLPSLLAWISSLRTRR